MDELGLVLPQYLCSVMNDNESHIHIGHLIQAQLKADERTCITLQLIDGYDIAAIAKITGIKAGTVKSHLSRGKEKLANYLRQNGYDRR